MASRQKYTMVDNVIFQWKCDANIAKIDAFGFLPPEKAHQKKILCNKQVLVVGSQPQEKTMAEHQKFMEEMETKQLKAVAMKNKNMEKQVQTMEELLEENAKIEKLIAIKQAEERKVHEDEMKEMKEHVAIMEMQLLELRREAIFQGVREKDLLKSLADDKEHA